GKIEDKLHFAIGNNVFFSKNGTKIEVFGTLGGGVYSIKNDTWIKQQKFSQNFKKIQNAGGLFPFGRKLTYPHPEILDMSKQVVKFHKRENGKQIGTLDLRTKFDGIINLDTIFPNIENDELLVPVKVYEQNKHRGVVIDINLRNFSIEHRYKVGGNRLTDIVYGF
ncbi:MAG: hypothetical protein ABEH43_07490, partial [Flavobacteriales bacterium]